MSCHWSGLYKRSETSRLLTKTHMLRCAQSPRCNVLVSTPRACPERSRRIDFSRASPLDLFEQPVEDFFFNLLLRSDTNFGTAFVDTYGVGECYEAT